MVMISEVCKRYNDNDMGFREYIKNDEYIEMEKTDEYDNYYYDQCIIGAVCIFKFNLI
jgi:hypothetical protein